MPQAVPQLENPVIVAPDCCAAVHVYVVPATVELKATLVVAPLQIVSGLAEPKGFGFTVMSTVNVFPGQLLGEMGVTVYLTTPGVALLVFVNVCAMLVPHAAAQFENPVIVEPDNWAAVHVNVELGTVELKVTDVVNPLQIV